MMQIRREMAVTPCKLQCIHSQGQILFFCYLVKALTLVQSSISCKCCWFALGPDHIIHHWCQVSWNEPTGTIVSMTANLTERRLHSLIVFPAWVARNPKLTVCFQNEHLDKMRAYRDAGPHLPRQIIDVFADITFLEDAGPNDEKVISCSPLEVPEGYVDQKKWFCDRLCSMMMIMPWRHDDQASVVWKQGLKLMCLCLVALCMYLMVIFPDSFDNQAGCTLYERHCLHRLYLL